MTTLPPLPMELLDDLTFVSRLRTELGSHGKRPGFFPTVQVREVCYRILSEGAFPHERRGSLYLGASILMLELLLERDDLRQKYRPAALMRALAEAVSRLGEQQRAVLLLHLFGGKEPAEIAEITALESVDCLLAQARASLVGRLQDSNFTLEDLAKGGIGPVGELTKVLEKVRQGELGIQEMFATGYPEMKEAVAPALRRGTIPGLEEPGDLVAESLTRLNCDPESAPRNRMELRSFVARIATNVMIDRVARSGQKRGNDVTHVELDETLSTGSAGQQEGRLLLQTLDEALLQMRKQDRIAPRHATMFVQDRLFAAMVKLRCEPERKRQCEVLLLRHQEGKTIEETAAELGISVAAVKRDSHAAIRFIRQELGLAEAATGTE